MEHDIRPRREMVPFLEHPVMVFLSRMMDMIILSILWLLCCIPVVTIGASTSALYYTTLKFARGDGAVKTVRTFFQGFRIHFLRSMLALPLAAVILAIAIADFLALYSGLLPMPADWFKYIFAIPIPVALMLVSYVFPLIAFYKDGVLTSFANAFRLVFKNIFVALLVTVINWLPVAWFFLNLESFLQFIVILTLLGPGAIGYINGILLHNVLKKHMRPSDFPYIGEDSGYVAEFDEDSEK